MHHGSRQRIQDWLEGDRSTTSKSSSVSDWETTYSSSVTSSRRRRAHKSDAKSKTSRTSADSADKAFPVDIKAIARWLVMIGNADAARGTYRHYTEYRRRKRGGVRLSKKVPSVPTALGWLKLRRPRWTTSWTSRSMPAASLYGLTSFIESWRSGASTLSDAPTQENEVRRRRRRRSRDASGDSPKTRALPTIDEDKQLRTRERRTKSRSSKARSDISSSTDRVTTTRASAVEKAALTAKWYRMLEELRAQNFNPTSSTLLLPSRLRPSEIGRHDDERSSRAAPPRCRSPLIPADGEPRRSSALTLGQTRMLAALLLQRDRQHKRAARDNADPAGDAESLSSRARERRSKKQRSPQPDINTTYRRDERARFWT